MPLQDIMNVGTGYPETFGPPKWVARPVRGVAASFTDTTEQEDWNEDWVRGVALANLAEAAQEEIAVIKTHQGGGVRAITWQVLQEETAKSQVCRQLLQLIGSGLPDRREDWPQNLVDYHRYKNQLLEIDGVVVCGERPLIPASLRPQALDILHAGHAGTSTMQSRSSQSLFWPGMTREIEERRARCKECIYRAPSQAALPLQPPIAPDYPFSYICADFFAVNGRTYLAVVDRFSNWLSLARFAKDDSRSVIGFLRSYFSRYGVAKEIKTDVQKTLGSAELRWRISWPGGVSATESVPHTTH